MITFQLTMQLNLHLNSETGDRFVSVYLPVSHLGCDIYEDGREIDWQDNDGLFANVNGISAAVVRAAARALLEEQYQEDRS
jgi:hypothetical protein